MSKLFFIDSENIGDSWITLLDAVDASDELLVFYTQKSPHMSYKNLIRLKNSPKDVNFIECFEGNNALDFQLVTELGYRLAAGVDSGNEYYIVSNDNGFEAAIRYWKRKGFFVRRFNSKACASISATITETYNKIPNEVTETITAYNGDLTRAADSRVIDTIAYETVSEKETDTASSITEGTVPLTPESAKTAGSGENSSAKAVIKALSKKSSRKKSGASSVTSDHNKASDAAKPFSQKERSKSTVSSAENTDVSKADAAISSDTAVSIPSADSSVTGGTPSADKQAAENDSKSLTADQKPEAESKPLADEQKPEADSKPLAEAQKPETESKPLADDSSSCKADAADAKPAVVLDTIEAALKTAADELEAITVDETSASVLYLVGRENLATLHEALMQLYGNEKCKILYNSLKSDRIYNKIPARYKKMSPEKRQAEYCKIVFFLNGADTSMPEGFAETVMKAWISKKNLNSLRATLQSKYGKEKGKLYYSFIKAHMKILENLN